ncbi:hypothetical protein [Flavonifractor plautii]
MVLAPFRDFLPLIAFDGDFNVAQHLFAGLADRRTQGGDGGWGIPVKDAQKVLMAEILLRVQPAAGHQRIGDAGGGGASERRPYVVIIIFLQKRIFNDAENIPLVVLPIVLCQPIRHKLQLIFQTVRAGNLIAGFQSPQHRVHVLVL